MKLSLALLTLAASAANAFVSPVSNNYGVSSLSMAKEADAEAPPAEEAEAAPAEEVVEEAAPVSKKVPCFGATPWVGGPKFVGENYWDKITQEWGSEATGAFVRAAELKHGRSAMLATVGYFFHKIGWTFNNISIHTYLSETQDIKFADLAAMNPVAAMKSLPAESWGQMFAFYS